MVAYNKLLPTLISSSEPSQLKDAFALIRELEKEGSTTVIGGGEHGRDSIKYDPTNFALAHDYNKEIRKASNTLLKSNVSPSDMLDLYYKTHLFDAPYNFDSFCLYIEKDRDVKKRFYLPRRKQLKVLVDSIQDFEDGKLDILGISLPPGVGKTTLAEFGLAWTSGKHPFLPNLIGSHNNDFLSGMYSEMLRIFDLKGEYRWGDVFPGLKVIATNAKTMQIGIGYEKVDDMRFRTLSFTSIGAGNAGKVRAMNWLYVDDLVRGAEQALSRERMDKLWQMYYTDLQQRMLGDKARQLVIGTRWSVADHIGRLEALNEGNDRARFINLPVADADGHSLFDYPYGLGYTDKAIQDLRDTWDEISFNAIYYGKPVEREGILYEPAELNRYFTLPDKEPDSILAICDTKEQGSDYCACPVFYQYGSEFYLDTIVFDNGKVEVIEERVARLLFDRKVRVCRIESNRGGTIFAQNVEKRLKELGGMTSITTRWTQSNKDTRIQTSSSIVKRHIWFKDESLYVKDREYRDAMRQLCSYSMVGRNKHDDFADVLSLFVDWQMSDRRNVATILKRPF